jgi:predicted transcriptional regulator
MSTTKDERFVLALYKKAKESGDIEGTYNRYEVGSSIGLQFRAVDAICRLLIQANFIKKKKGEEDIYLTSHGIKLAEKLLEEFH